MKKTLELHMELRDMNPKIWRKIIVPNNIKLSELAYIVLTVFEMKANHLYKIIAPKGKILFDEYKRKSGKDFDVKQFRKEHPDIETIRYRYELLNIIDDYGLNPKSNDIVYDVNEEKLSHAMSMVGEYIELWYDFGDDWFIDIKLVDIQEVDDEFILPCVIDGKGFGILEDIGGVHMLQEVYASCKKEHSKKCKEYLEWYGLEFKQFKTFDIDEMNERLQIIPSIFKRSYEHKKSPTKVEIDYIDRVKKTI